MNWEEVSNYLRERSKEICELNECTEDEHNCDSYAYITENGELLDVCCPDYFQGYSGQYASIPMPWNGTGENLEYEVLDQIE